MVFGWNAKSKKYGHGGSVLRDVGFGDQTLLEGAIGDAGSGGRAQNSNPSITRRPNLETFDFETKTRAQTLNPSALKTAQATKPRSLRF